MQERSRSKPSTTEERHVEEGQSFMSTGLCHGDVRLPNFMVKRTADNTAGTAAGMQMR